MKDIDFDELDRAVSSLMGDVDSLSGKPESDERPEGNEEIASPAAAVETEADAETVVDIPTEDESTPEEAEEKVDKVEDAEPEVDDSEPAKIVTRSRGKFMDIVSGGSSPKPTKTATAVASVKKPVIEPSTKFEENILSSKPDDTTESVPDVSNLDDVDTSNNDDQIATPFLTDAKVEKRPLGSGSPIVQEDLHDDVAPADTINASQAPELSSEQVSNEPEADADGDMQASVPTQMPAELSSDIVSVEAGGVVASQGSDDSDEDLPDIDTPSSIPQQYKTAHNDDDQPKATIYDAHQDVARATKKKHTGVWILLTILICIIVGAGGGYLAYSLKVFG